MCQENGPYNVLKTRPHITCGLFGLFSRFIHLKTLHLSILQTLQSLNKNLWVPWHLNEVVWKYWRKNLQIFMHIHVIYGQSKWLYILKVQRFYFLQIKGKTYHLLKAGSNFGLQIKNQSNETVEHFFSDHCNRLACGWRSERPDSKIVEHVSICWIW